MKFKKFIPALLFLLMQGGPLEAVQWPVLFLKYDVESGNDITEDRTLDISSYKHTVSFRIREEWRSPFTTNAYFSYTRKEYIVKKGDYFSFSVNPDFTWKISDCLKWVGGFQSKWVVYDEPDSEGSSKNYTCVSFDTELSYKAGGLIDFNPGWQGRFYLYENRQKSKQEHTFDLYLSTRLKNIIFTGHLKGILEFPLNRDSPAPSAFKPMLGIDFTWDPND